MPMIEAVKTCKDTEQLARDLATFTNCSTEETIALLNPKNWYEDARNYGIKI